MTCRILIGDCRTVLRTLPDESVHCVVTSPPYFGLRDYGMDGQLGQEPTPADFVAVMVEVFREVRRVLRADGTLWLNLGDSYQSTSSPQVAQTKDRGTQRAGCATRPPPSAGLKPKDLMGVPWRVAFALQADGWWLRQDIIWAKPNPMPESVTDRCTKAKAGCPVGGTVLDPFGGSGTTGLVADRLGRNSILIELNPEYAAMAERRIRDDAPLFTKVAAE